MDSSLTERVTILYSEAGPSLNVAHHFWQSQICPGIHKQNHICDEGLGMVV